MLNKPEIDFDIAIIGGGPAASSAAIYAAKQGLKVCIIERENFPRDRPGETLHPGVEPILNQLNVLDAVMQANFIRHSGTLTTWNAPTEFQAFNSAENQEDWFGFQAYRRVFDVLLIEQAKKLGVQIYMGCNASKLICNNNRVVGVIVNEKEIFARYIIDASGNWHWCARQLNIPLQTYSKKLFVRYGYVTGVCPVRDQYPMLIADKKGWTWTARIDHKLYQWTRLTFINELPPANWLPDEFQNLQPQGSAKGADVTWRIAECLAGPGFFLSGDAAAVLDPASSHGVLKALMTGIRAADLISYILHKRCPEMVAIKAYQEWLLSWFHHDIQVLDSLYNKLGVKIILK